MKGGEELMKRSVTFVFRYQRPTVNRIYNGQDKHIDK